MRDAPIYLPADGVRALPKTGPAELSPRERNTADEALGVMPINPRGPGLVTQPWGVPPFYAFARNQPEPTTTVNEYP